MGPKEASLYRERRPSYKRRFVLGDHVRSLARLAELSEVASGSDPEIIGQVLSAVKEELGMEVAFVSEFAGQRMVFRRLVGESESFGWQEGASIPLDDTFCRLLTEGRLPSVVPDAESNGLVKQLDVTGEARIGSYVGVPVRFSDGSLYGTLCALSHSPDPSLKERDAQFAKVLARLVAEQLERERSLRLRAGEHARADERRRIARELHDRVAHTIGVVHQSLQLHEVLRGRDPVKAAQKMELAKHAAKEAMEQTRDLSRALREAEAGKGLKAALSELLRDAVPPGIDCELSVAGDEAAVPAGVREQLFLLLREAVRNAVSHSGAGKVAVSLSIDRERITGVVEDDGRGFDRKTTEAAEVGGLAHMAERASLLGGVCSVYSVPGEGTRVEASFPSDGA